MKQKPLAFLMKVADAPPADQCKTSTWRKKLGQVCVTIDQLEILLTSSIHVFEVGGLPFLLFVRLKVNVVSRNPVPPELYCCYWAMRCYANCYEILT